MARDLPSERPRFDRARDAPMTAAQRRAVAKVVREDRAKRKQDKERQRVAAKIKAGTFVSPKDRERLVKAGVDLDAAHGLLGKTALNLMEAGVYTLPGIYEAGKAVTLDAADTVRGRPTGKRTARIGQAIGESVVETAKHPLRRPGDTLLLGLAAFSGGASALSRARAGTIRKPPPKIRKFTLGEAEAMGTYSKSPGRALLQEALDKRAVSRAEQGKSAALERKFAKAASRNRMIEEAAGRAPEQTVRHAGRKLTPGQEMALRAYEENTPLDSRLALAKGGLAKAKTSRERARLRREIGLIEAARPYVTTDAKGDVRIVKDFDTPRKRVRKGASPQELRSQAARVIRGGQRREQQGIELGLLDESGVDVRRDAPALVTGEERRGRAYLGYGNRRARDVVFSPFASRSGAKPKVGQELSGSLKEFAGGNLRRADYEHKTSKVAASGMAAMNRHHTAVRLNQRLFAAGSDARPADTLSTRYVPVRDRDLSPKAMETLRSLAQKIDDDEVLAGPEKLAYERALRDLETPEVASEHLGAEVGAKIKGVRWVPQRVFEKVSQVGQRGSVPTHRSERFVRAVAREFNAGLRALVLYSTGAGAGYVTPNLAANVGLLAAQGGPKMIPAAKRALNPTFRKRAGEDAWRAGLARMGEGFMTSTFAERAGRGPMSAGTQAWSRALGRVTDQETRMISLVYEAGERGYKTPERFRALMLDPKHADEAMDVTIRARDAALDYELMTPAERSYVASWLFVYPFIRASSRYTMNFPADHPFQAAVYSQLANIARENDDLGPRSTRDAGLVKIGDQDIPGVGMLPRVVNTNAVSPFTALPDVVSAVTGFLSPSAAGPERGRSILDLASPAVAAAIETVAGKDSFTGRPVPRNVRGFGQQVVKNIPAVRDIGQYRKDDEARARQVSPRTPHDVLVRQGLGSVAPRPYNPEIAAKYEERDRLAKYPPAKRARIRVFSERQDLLEAVRRRDPDRLENGRLPKRIRDAYNREAEVYAARAKAEDEANGDRLSYHRRAIEAEARLLEKWGAVPKGFAAEVVDLAATTDNADKIARARDRLRSRYMVPSYQEITTAARKYIEEAEG